MNAPIRFYYNSYTTYLKQHFGTRVQKLSVHAGLTCPNRDGSKGTGGCIYCLNEAFTPSYCTPEKSITQQLHEGIEFHKNRYRRAGAYLAYFQSFSNTYVSAETLEQMCRESLMTDGVKGIITGTRPDCINQEIVKVLAKLSNEIFVKVELGIESVFDDTLQFIRRGHSMKETVEAIRMLKAYNIPVGGHLILGLPGDDKERILESAAIVSSLGLFSIKLHQLQILKGTELEKLYMTSPEKFQLFELAEYIDIVIDFCERLHPDLYIERFAGEVPPRFLVAPDWGLIRYDQVLEKIHRRFAERKTWQGKFFAKA